MSYPMADPDDFLCELVDYLVQMKILSLNFNCNIIFLAYLKIITPNKT